MLLVVKLTSYMHRVVFLVFTPITDYIILYGKLAKLMVGKMYRNPFAGGSL